MIKPVKKFEIRSANDHFALSVESNGDYVAIQGHQGMVSFNANFIDQLIKVLTDLKG